jgi:CubicO group peptidase (beta-lactamase class C family)
MQIDHTTRRTLVRSALLAGVLAIGVGTIGLERARAFDPGAPIVRAEPDSVGMSSARLKKLTAAFDKEVADKRLPGAVAMISRKGKLVYAQPFGVRDPRAEDPMKLDSVFRIYSMTKPMAAVAGMILVEDGVLQLTDPVAKWLPAFKDVKVSTPSGDVPAERPMTVVYQAIVD